MLSLPKKIEEEMDIYIWIKFILNILIL
jgi:hypothetical protein